MATDATISSLVQEIRGFSTVGSNKTCSDRKSKKNKYGNGMCYKTSVWTDFRQGQGQDRNRTVVYYQSTMDGEHMTWKLCDRVQSGLERLGRVQKELELGMMSRDMGSSWCTHGMYMYSGD